MSKICDECKHWDRIDTDKGICEKGDIEMLWNWSCGIWKRKEVE